jgi:hypothetical protein
MPARKQVLNRKTKFKPAGKMFSTCRSFNLSIVSILKA